LSTDSLHSSPDPSPTAPCLINKLYQGDMTARETNRLPTNALPVADHRCYQPCMKTAIENGQTCPGRLRKRPFSWGHGSSGRRVSHERDCRDRRCLLRVRASTCRFRSCPVVVKTVGGASRVWRRRVWSLRTEYSSCWSCEGSKSSLSIEFSMSRRLSANIVLHRYVCCCSAYVWRYYPTTSDVTYFRSPWPTATEHHTPLSRLDTHPCTRRVEATNSKSCCLHTFDCSVGTLCQTAKKSLA